MGRFLFIAGLSFRAKMLMAVTIVMSLLVVVSLWLVRQQFKKQINGNAAFTTTGGKSSATVEFEPLI